MKLKQLLIVIVVVFVVEIMGHKVGHICLSGRYCSRSGCRFYFQKFLMILKVVAKKIKENQKAGKEYTIIACAEGAISRRR